MRVDQAGICRAPLPVEHWRGTFAPMKSPFPGMDPYLEKHWRDVHASLVHDARNAIQRQLGGGLRARIDERLIVEEEGILKRAIFPDVQVSEQGFGAGVAVLKAPADVAVAEPLVLHVTPRQLRETFVQIIDPASDGRIITLIEFVSPTNKALGEGRRLYLEKQEEAIIAGVSLVEIDLTRGGAHVFRFNRAEILLKKRAEYFASVWRASRDPWRFEVYPIALRERLPAIRIPLRPDDRDVVLDLQELIVRAYEEGRHDDLDYAAELDPPLAEEDRAWAAELLKDARSR